MASPYGYGGQREAERARRKRKAEDERRRKCLDQVEMERVLHGYNDPSGSTRWWRFESQGEEKQEISGRHQEGLGKPRG